METRGDRRRHQVAVLIRVATDGVPIDPEWVEEQLDDHVMDNHLKSQRVPFIPTVMQSHSTSS